MYWKKGEIITTCPVIPFYVSGTTYDFTLTLVTEAGEDLAGVVLTVAEAAYAGWVQAKLGTELTYLDIMEPFNGTCALGDIDAETETEIDFRVNFAEATADGTKYIAILVQYGDGISVPILLVWMDSFWADPQDVTYVSSSEFTLPGDQTTELRGNQRLRLSQGADGTAEVTCVSRLFSSGNNLTTITVSPALVTANVVTVERALTYSEGSYGNLCEHPHTGRSSGGTIPSAVLSEDEVGDLQAISALASLEGLLTREGETFIAVSSSAALQMLRRNAADDAYEFVLVVLSDISDVELTDIATGDTLYRGPDGKWINLPVDDDDKILTLVSGVPAWAAPASTVVSLKDLDDVVDAVTDSAATGDILYRTASGYDRIPISETETDILGISGGIPAWVEPPSSGEANTSSSDGGGVEITKTKDGVDLPFKTFDSSQFEEATSDVISIKASVLGSAVTWTGAWVTGTPYATATGVTNGGYSYICYSPHTSGASTEPGVGVDWETVWQPVGSYGETNTSSNDGGGVEIAKAKDGVDLPFKTLDSSQFEEAVTDVINIKASVLGGSGGAPPTWSPPSFVYKDVDEIYLRPGRYYKGGYRHRGQYQDLTGLGSYWDVASLLSVDIDGTYSAGSVSGMIGGAKVNSSWYSVFMMGNDANSVLALPFVRIKAIAYSSDTTINPGDHNTGASYENGFFTANDAWNTYRLVKWSFDVYDGTIYTIADTVDGTNDEIHITGDKTSELAAGEWLQLVPPSGTDCVYLGVIRIDGSGNLRSFKRHGWTYGFTIGPIDITGNKATSPGNTEIASAIPPCASAARFNIGMDASANLAKLMDCLLYDGTTEASYHTHQVTYGNITDSAKSSFWHGHPTVWLLSASSVIRNLFRQYNSAGSWVAADNAWFHMTGFDE